MLNIKRAQKDSLSCAAVWCELNIEWNSLSQMTPWNMSQLYVERKDE